MTNDGNDKEQQPTSTEMFNLKGPTQRSTIEKRGYP